MKDEISEPNKVIGNGSAVKPVAPGENMHIRFDSMEESDVSDRNGKQIMILKNPADDLGMAILGGKEHNLPIIISEIFPDSAVSRAPRVSDKTMRTELDGSTGASLTSER